MRRRRLLRFVTVGVGAALLLFVLSFAFRSAGMPPFLASVIGYAIAFAAAYLAQWGWTFEAAHSHGEAFPRYLASQLGCGLLSGVVGYATVEGLGFPPFWMSAAVMTAAGASSYLLSTYWVFPQRR